MFQNKIRSTTFLNKIIWSLALLILVVAPACNKDKYIKPGDTLDVAYKKAMRFYTEGNYTDASDAFETLISMGRGTDYAEDAQYRLAQSYFKNEKYLLAASEYERYASLYPRSERREEVDFKRALCYYYLSPRYKLDQKHTNRSIELFQLFLSRNPDSDRAPEAASYIDEMREKLAHKIYGAADLYMRIDRYKAAAIYYGQVIDRYPETSWAEKALVDQIYAYVEYADNSVFQKQKERYNKAVASYEKYVQLFPEGEHRSQAEEYYDRAKVGLERVRKIVANGGLPPRDTTVEFLGMTFDFGWLTGEDRSQVADTTIDRNPRATQSPASSGQPTGRMGGGQ